MRASKRLAVALALASTFAAAKDAWAHRSEDYLQAARIGLERDGVHISLDLTPGIALSDSFVASLDRDRDGALSADEQRAYAEVVVSALTVEHDGLPLRPRLVSWTFPELEAFRHGEGAIRLELQSTLPERSAGAHRFFFRNAHMAEHSVYLANALVPESRRIAVTAQRRDPDQSELTIEYTVRVDSNGMLAWALGSLAAAGFLMLRYRTSTEKAAG